jgi:hypothetical protein
MRLASDHQTLSRAKPEALRRLARYVGVECGCECWRCTMALVEALARRLQ